MSENDNSNVVILPVETTLDLPVERILDGGRDADLFECLLLGYSDDGFYMACTTVNAGTMLVLLERCRDQIMRRLRETA